MNLIELKEQLDARRAVEAQLSERLGELEAVRDKFIEGYLLNFAAANRDLIEETSAATLAAAAAEDMLRAAVEAAWMEEQAAALREGRKPSKQFGPGLSVRVTTRLVYAEADALAWSKTNAPFLVRESIDRKQFETAIKSLSLPFVAIEEKAYAVLSA